MFKLLTRIKFLKKIENFKANTKNYAILTIIFLGLFFTAYHCAPSYAGDYFEGNGSPDSPFKIDCAEKLVLFAKFVNDDIGDYSDKHYALDEDIDLSGYGHSYNEGAGWIPIGDDKKQFKGSFDGQSHKITGLYINRENSDYQGLFGYIGKNGVVKNLGISGSAEKFVSVKGRDSVGGVAGRVDGKVTYCYNTADITGRTSVGGVAGSVEGGTVSDSCNMGAVIGESRFTGGVVGDVRDGNITNSFNAGSVSGFWGVGGVAGTTSGRLTNSYNAGSISGLSHTGGVIGDISARGIVTNSCNSGSIVGNGVVGGVAGSVSGGTVANCCNTGSVAGEQVKFEFESPTNWIVGGVAAHINKGGIVTNSYSMGDVTGTEIIGGVVGYIMGGTVSYSYSTGSVNSKSVGGGIAGVVLNEDESTGISAITDCVALNPEVKGNIDVNRVAGRNFDGILNNNYSRGNMKCESKDSDGIAGIEIENVNSLGWPSENIWSGWSASNYWMIEKIDGGFRPVLHIEKIEKTIKKIKETTFNTDNETNAPASIESWLKKQIGDMLDGTGITIEEGTPKVISFTAQTSDTYGSFMFIARLNKGAASLLLAHNGTIGAQPALLSR